jgi:hypothetical protein
VCEEERVVSLIAGRPATSWPVARSLSGSSRATDSLSMSLRALCARLPPEVIALTRSLLVRSPKSRSLATAAAASTTTTKTYYATTPIFYVNAGASLACNQPA